jgi:hypothetical protein
MKFDPRCKDFETASGNSDAGCFRKRRSFSVRIVSKDNSICDLCPYKVGLLQQKLHGGARKGAGRPKGSGKKEETVVIRVPKSKVDAVRKLIK